MTLLTAFHQRLIGDIRLQMVIYDDRVGLESFIQKAIKISQHLHACKDALPLSSPISPASPPPASEPMQVDSNHLTRAERTRRITSGLCLYCGQNGYLISSFPVRPACPVVSTIQLSPQIATLTRMNVSLMSSHQSLSAQALVDSGSSFKSKR